MRTSKNTVNTPTKQSLRFKRFLKDSGGVSGMLMGLTAIPVIMLTGAAIDFAYISREQPAYYQAVDNAALAVAADDRSFVNENWSETEKEARRQVLEEYAKQIISANYKDKVYGEPDLAVRLEFSGQAVDIESSLTIPTSFSRIFGMNDVTLHTDTSARKAMRPIEMSLVLDTTGSMRNDMAALKTATNKLLSTLYSDPSPTSKNMQSPNIRVALVPFAGAVRLDPLGFDFSMDWIDTLGTNPISRINFNLPTWNNFMAWGKLRVNASTPMTWNGCVESRTALGPDGSNYITNDIEPGLTNIHSKFPAYFNPDSASTYITSGNTTRYRTASGSVLNGRWNNNYINANRDWASTAHSSLLAPSGANKTGFDDSVIGNNSTGFDARWKNSAKYDGKIIPVETLTASGTSWSMNSGPWQNCTASKVVPMTHDRSKIEAGVTSMKAVGGTNIAEGLAWGMRVLSPSAPFTQAQGATGIEGGPIAPYNGPKWQKIMVLMTDGQNDPYGGGGALTDTGTYYNSFGAVTTTTTGNLNRYGSTSYSNAGSKLDSYTTTMCNNLKASGVTIYTIGFRLDSSLMKNCATSLAHYKYVTSTGDLVTYFDSIGQDVLNKMVYVAK